MNPPAWSWPAAIEWQRRLLIAAGVGALLCAFAAYWDTTQFLRSYLFGYLSWLGIVLGSLAIWMIHQLTGGEWGYVLQRPLEAASRTLPWLAVLFLPIALGLAWIYPWLGESHELHGPKAQYLNMPFFLVRTAIYFVLWIGLVLWLGHCSATHDRTGDPAAPTRANQISGPGLVIYGLTFTFAAIDWIMSLEPEWYSSIFGALIATAEMLPALALAIIIASWRMPDRALAEIATPDVWNDLGNLLLAFVMLWTYMSLSQFLIIWSGNLPEEITWYLHRTEGGWQWLALLLGIAYFAMPFVVLLSRGMKRDPRRLRYVAMVLVAMHFLNHFWMIKPSFSPGEFSLHWMDVLTWATLGCGWLVLYLRELQARPIVAVHRVVTAEEALHHA